VVLSGNWRGKQSAYLSFIAAFFCCNSSWNAIISMCSQTTAMTCGGRRYPANAGSPVSSRKQGFGTQILFGVGGGIIHGGVC
jgi:hypothetical protein